MLPLEWSENSNALPLPDWITDTGVDQAFSPNQACSFHLLSWTNLPLRLISDSQMIRGQPHACYIFWATDCLLTLPGGAHQSIRRQSVRILFPGQSPHCVLTQLQIEVFPDSCDKSLCLLLFLWWQNTSQNNLSVERLHFGSQFQHHQGREGMVAGICGSQEAKSRQGVLGLSSVLPTFKGVHPTSMNWIYKIPLRHAQGCVSRVILDPVKLMPIQNIIATNPTHEASSQMWLHTLKDPKPMTSTLEIMFLVMNMGEGLNNLF